MDPQRNGLFLVSQLPLLITGGWFYSTKRGEDASAGGNDLGRFEDSKLSALSSSLSVFIPCANQGSTSSQTMSLLWYKRHVKVIYLFGVATPKP